jgi:hypothetical protein
VHRTHAPLSVSGLEFPPRGVPARSRPARARRRRSAPDDSDGDLAESGSATRTTAAVGRHCHRRPRRHALLFRLARLVALAGLVLAVARPLAGDVILSSAAEPADPATAGVRDWVMANLDPATALLVPAAVADELSRHGHHALVGYGGDAGAIDWRCCPFLVTLSRPGTPPEQTLPAPVRPAYERSRLLAVFAGGHRRGEVREITTENATAAGAALVADRAARLEAAAALAKNPRLAWAPDARTSLLAGEVDARVLIALAGLTGKHALTVSEFVVQSGEAATGVPRRAVAITAIDGRPVHPDEAGTKDVQAFLMSQVPPYRPDALPVVREGVARTLTISFRAPSPIGLLAPAS